MRRDKIGWSLNDTNSKFPDPKEGESVADVYTRAESFLNNMREKHPGDTILLVCHGYIGKILIGILSGKSKDDISSGASLKNTSLSIYKINEDKNEALIIDSISHLFEPPIHSLQSLTLFPNNETGSDHIM